MKPIYLCGPINGRTDADAKNWREEFTRLWEGEVLDPMRRDFRGREQEPGIAAEIVTGDIEDIYYSAALVVMFDKPSVGTAMEIFFAKTQLELPIVIIDASDKPLSPWLTHHSDIVVKDVAAAVTWLKEKLA